MRGFICAPHRWSECKGTIMSRIVRTIARAIAEAQSPMMALAALSAKQIRAKRGLTILDNLMQPKGE
jgi:hypothetical protein